MRTKYIWLFTFILSIPFTHIAQACVADINQNAHCFCNNSEHDYFSKLHLTDDQKIQIQSIRNKAHDKLKLSYEQLGALNKLTSDMISADKLDEAQLDRLIAQKSALKATILKNKVLMLHQIYIHLPAAQKAEYKKLTQRQHKSAPAVKGSKVPE